VRVHCDDCEEGAELALDEAWHRALALPGAGQEGLKLLLDHTVEDALLGAAARVAPLLATASCGMRMRARGSALVHAGRSLPALYRSSGASRVVDRAWPEDPGLPVHIRIAADRSLNEPAHGARAVPQSACSMPADESSRRATDAAVTRTRTTPTLAEKSSALLSVLHRIREEMR
jgi:hypothetical protein